MAYLRGARLDGTLKRSESRCSKGKDEVQAAQGAALGVTRVTTPCQIDRTPRANFFDGWKADGILLVAFGQFRTGV